MAPLVVSDKLPLPRLILPLKMLKIGIVDRPVLNIVKISHIEETTFMDDINDIHNLAKERM